MAINMEYPMSIEHKIFNVKQDMILVRGIFYVMFHHD